MIRIIKVPLLIMVMAVAVTWTGFLNKGYTDKQEILMQEKIMDKNLEVATFAGGCFWCIEAAFEKIEGVLEAVSGYCGGHVDNPSYEQVTSGSTGHYEAVQVRYDPEILGFEQLLGALFRQIDPTDGGGSFVDRGPQYRSAVFFHNQDQKQKALDFISKIDASGRFDAKVATQVIPFDRFFPAEAYHQDYHRKNPVRYKFYRMGSGRDKFIDKAWGRQDQTCPVKFNAGQAKGKKQVPDKDMLRQNLSELQYHVTQEDGTEPAFNNRYWDNKKPGIYVDIVSKDPLFSSTDKFNSGTGWPSFTRPIEADAVITRKDRSWLMTRTEVRSAGADSHLGHVFSDGPEPTGLRYCINSAALEFVPVADLEEKGLGKYRELFQ